MGKQRRVRNNNGQIQEQNCFVPCLNKNSSKSEGIYSNWTNWSACQLPNCTSTRTRHCLQDPCLNNFIETRPCKTNFCSSKTKNKKKIFIIFFLDASLISSSTLNVIIYSSISIGAMIFLLLAILFIFLCYRRRQHITRKEGIQIYSSSFESRLNKVTFVHLFFLFDRSSGNS